MVLHIKILGPGDANFQKLEDAARRAVDNFRAAARIERVHDTEALWHYNVLATPALVINERLVSAGALPSDSEVMSWVADALMVG